ncbi:PRA1 family protein B4-like [Apium graveolens]|uniref:PRA1 family protein B4-like n=1 Tax=Apium graveolens TaxID=4045 RepID=UPI003D798C27
MASNPEPANLPPIITQPAAPGGSADSLPPAAAPAVRAFFSNIIETARQRLACRRPWSELVDRSAFSKPESVSDATARIRKNFTYFRVNYLCLIALIMIFSLVTHPYSLLLLLGLLTAWIFLYLFRPADPPVIIFGRTFSERETLGILVLSTIVVIFLTSVGYVLTSALMGGLAIVCAHGAFRVPEDLFLDEPADSAATGFLSFIKSATTAPPSAPVVVATVRV